MKSVCVSLLFLIGLASQVLGEEGASNSYPGGQKYDKLLLSELLIKSNRLVTCIPVLNNLKENEDPLLFTLQDIKPVIENDGSSTGLSEHLYVVCQTKASWNTPVIVPGRKHLLFLKDLEVNDTFRTKYGLDASAKVLELCHGWQASICLDFTVESLARNLLQKRYGIRDETQFLNAVKRLAAWRAKGDNRTETIKNLQDTLHVTDKSGGNLIYQDNAPGILRHLELKTRK